MIEKMKFVSITGPKEDFDRMVGTYLSNYEVHLENALSELKTIQNLRPFIEQNPYKDKLAQVNLYVKALPDAEAAATPPMDAKEALEVVERIRQSVASLETADSGLNRELDRIRSLKALIEPFKEISVDLQKVREFRFIKVRFGRIANEHYKRLEHYMLDDENSIFYKCGSDLEYVWGVYFVPETVSMKVDAMYASMYFERMELPDECEGMPMEVYLDLDAKCRDLEAKAEEIRKQKVQILESQAQKLMSAKESLESLSESFDIRKLAACFQEEDAVFYILCGWMPASDARAFAEAIKEEEHTFCMQEDVGEQAFQGPPTKLKNPRIFKPFEMFTKMYGMPSYNEMDPTIFIALTYTIIFGAMFGDVGQGLVLVVGGALLYKWKKNNLAGIIACAGVFSTIFGVLFGSVFGFEDVIEAVWLHPRTNTMQVPLIGELNTVFVVAIGLGMGLILLTMLFHIINAIREKDKEALFFDTNGVAGLVFYASVVTVAVLLMTHHPMPATVVLLVMFVLPLLLIALKEPLGKLVEHKAGVMPKEKGMFVIQTFFELFEVLLSYFSNTLSFVRVGAFAISHAAMMEVVLTLAGVESGSTNWVVIVLGNVIVCGLEGLIVGIQVLRLEYYEMFSRFYKGTGREFISYKTK